MTSREVVEGKKSQGVDENIAYTITTTNWGSTPSSVTVKAFDITKEAYLDVTSTVMPDAVPSPSGDVITLPKFGSLTAGHRYKIEVKFTCSGNVFECYLFVDADT